MPRAQKKSENELNEQTPESREGGQLAFAYDRKSLGAFYTPAAVANLLAKWAIRCPQDKVLEPGFGGCEFLEASIKRLNDLGCLLPQSQLMGCDIDPSAFDHLADKLGTVRLDGRYLCKDFLNVRPSDFLSGDVDVVIGNPPYVSHHNMSPAQKSSVRAWKDQSRFCISGRSSLWAYFILHAISFLTPRGRMAWVLPGSLVNSNYGRQVLGIVAAQFSRTYALEMNERVFLSVGTEEKTVILLCDGFGVSDSVTRQIHCRSVSHLAEILAEIVGNEGGETHSNCPARFPIFDQLVQRIHTTTLGDVSRVLIGTVTGANKFFVISPSRARQIGLSSRYLRPIVAKFGDLNGAVFADTDALELKERDKACLLFYIPDLHLSNAAKAYIDSFPEEKRLSNSTFSRREDWLAADDGRVPDAFLSYMVHAGPRIVLNTARVNCTNTVHRVYFNQPMSLPERKLACISLCTTFSQLSAEIEGRSYGSGVLKIEPSEAKRIRLHLPDKHTPDEIDSAFDEFDMCLRNQGIEHARAIADGFIFSNISPEIPELIRGAEAELVQARKQRMHQRHGK